MKRLVTYFSCSGITKEYALKLAKEIHADVYEIKPETPYSNADLNWMDKNSRSSLEMKDKSSRPKVVLDDFDFSKYEEIFVGYPVWWYTAPTIINTFLEAHDFSGKTIILWATSGSSGLGSSKKDLSVSTKGKIVEGDVLNHGQKLAQFVAKFSA